MTPEQINIACAERLGWKLDKTNPKYEWIWINPDGFQMGWSDTSMICTAIPGFHGSMDAAMQLVEFAKRKGFKWSAFIGKVAYQCQFHKHTHDLPLVAKDSLSAAICEAFLKLPAE